MFSPPGRLEPSPSLCVHNVAMSSDQRAARLAGSLRAAVFAPTTPARWFLAPGVGVLIIFFLAPLILLLVASLSRDFPSDTTVDPANYLAFLEGGYYTNVLIATLVFGAAVAFLCLLVGYPIAFYLVRHATRSRGIILAALVAPLLAGAVVRTLGWTILLGVEGILNATLQAVGLTTQPLSLLYNSVAATVGMVHVLLPFMVFAIASSLSMLDVSHEEAARSLGASPRHVFWRITFPLSFGGVAVGLALSYSLAVGAYITPVLLGGGKMQILAPAIYSRIVNLADWSSGAAMGVILMVIAVVVVGVVVPLLSTLVGTRRRGHAR